MSRLRFNKITTPATPAANKGELFYSSTLNPPGLAFLDENGTVRRAAFGTLNNFSTVAQSPAAATRTYIAGSAIVIPASKLQIGSMFRWGFNITKTAAGTATSTYDICVGTAGTTADTARVSFTKPVGTAVADEGWVEIVAICRGPLSASGIFTGEFILMHNSTAGGHLAAATPFAVLNTISGAFDVTTAGLIVGVCITSGASDAITIQQVTAEAFNV